MTKTMREPSGGVHIPPVNMPMGFLLKYQRRMIEEVLDGVGLVTVPYGRGKSAVAIGAATSHFNQLPSEVKRLHSLILCKPRHFSNWTDELNLRLAPNDHAFKPRIHHIRYDNDMTLLRDTQAADIALVSINLLSRSNELRQHLSMLRPGTIILDESTCIKNTKTNLFKEASAVSDALPPHTLRIAMTGKPMPESPIEIWGQMQFVYGDRNPLGSTFYRFLNNWCTKADYEWVLQNARREEFLSLVNNYTVGLYESEDAEYRERMKSSKQYIIEYYQETPEQLRLLEHLYTHWELPKELNGTPVLDFVTPGNMEEYSHTMTLRAKARTLSSSFYYDRQGKPQKLNGTPKLDALCDIVDTLMTEGPRKIVVWRSFKYEDKQLAFALGSLSAGLQVFVGSNQTAAFAKTQHPAVCIMPVQCGDGINDLVVADTAIYYSGTESVEYREQSEARLLRLGQTSSRVQIIDMCGSLSIDRDVLTHIHAKTLNPERLKALVNKYSTSLKKK